VSDDADERASARVGTVLNDKWTLEKLIGIGGMAAVYAGVHRNGARAAIKVLHPAYARRADVKRRFLREGYAANRVGHSGVVKVLDDDEIASGPDEGGAFLVMELLEGESIEDRLERGPPIGESELLPIARAVLDVLEAAHEAGVVHRDLKPENLFLARDPEHPDAPPRIKILDFGLARVAEGGGKTMAGIAIGTPSYMPPEQAAGRVQEIDARSDLFALGASCFRILANRTVHPAESALAICARMARDPAPKLRSVAPNVSEKTARVVDRALEFRRDDRWPNAATMRAAVDEAIAELGVEVITIESGMIEVVQDSPKLQQSRASEPEPEPEPARASPLPKLPKKRTGTWLMLLLLLGASAVGVKVAVDRGLIPWPPLGDEGAEAATTTPTITPTNTPSSVPFIDATVTVDASPNIDATQATPPESSDAETDTSTGIADAEVADVTALTDAAMTSHLPDAGAHHRHDGGTHHPPGSHNPRHHK
jgi:eukaryotic-like serine/threonine-protein kinase